MTVKKPFAYLTALIIFLIFIFAVFHINYQKNIIKETDGFLKGIYKTERNYIENIPIFDDFTTPEKEKS